MGWHTRQRFRPGSSAVKLEGSSAEVELASKAPGGAWRSRSAKTCRFTSPRSGVFSCTWSTRATAAARSSVACSRPMTSAGVLPRSRSWRARSGSTPSMKLSAAGNAAASASHSRTSWPARTKVWPRRARRSPNRRWLSSWPPHRDSTFPSTPSDCPEMLAPAGDRRNSTVAATSSGPVMRRSEMRLRYSPSITS